MKRSIFYILGFCALVFFSISCVSGKKYSSLQDTSKQFMNERDAFKTDNIGLQMQNKELELKLANLDKKMAKVKLDITAAESSRDKAQEDLSKISSRYNELQ